MEPAPVPRSEPDLKETIRQLSELATGHSLLYVEDEMAIQEELADLFANIFQRVVTARNGREGLECYHREKFSLVVTDLNMPDIGGLEMIEDILGRQPRQPVIVTSAHSDAKYLVPLINLGVSSFILKPVNLRNVLTMVQKELLNLNAQELEDRYQKRLKKEIQLRTAELQEAMAEIIKLQMAKDKMVALISHELRTPLNGLLGFTELVRQQVADPELLQYLGMIQASAARLDRSTSKALDFIRLTTGGRLLHKKEFAFRPLVQTAVKEVADRLHRTLDGVASFHHFDPAVVILTDVELALEAIKNIVENALKYGGDDQPMRIEFVQDDTWFQLRIRDFGAGFPEEILADGFQLFSSGNLMHHGEGLGLGLALTDVIMLSLGGKISLSNAAEGGAVVQLSFPRHG